MTFQLSYARKCKNGLSFPYDKSTYLINKFFFFFKKKKTLNKWEYA